MSPSMVTSWLKGKNGCNWRERESMSSRVHKLVKFIPFHHVLKWLSPCNTRLVFSQIWVILPSIKGLLIYKFLPFIRKGLLVISSWKSVWFVLRCVEMVSNMYILWDMEFVICMGIICRYFVGHGSCICIICETWSLEIYEKYVWVFCEECVL